MDAMKSDCEEVIMRDPTTWKPGPNGKPEPPTAVSDEICPNQCSKNGKCVKGKCVCIAGFLTEDCSVKKGNYNNYNTFYCIHIYEQNLVGCQF